MMIKDIFISYSSKNKELAFEICTLLEEHYLKCWIAPRDVRSGIPYAREIINGIKECSIVLLVLTKDSNQSEHVLREIYHAFNEGKVLISYFIDEISENEELSYYMQNSIRISQQNHNELVKHIINILSADAEKSTLTIDCDFECRVLVDNKEQGISTPLEPLRIPMPQGHFKIEFATIDYAYTRCIEHDNNEIENTIDISLTKLIEECLRQELETLSYIHSKYSSVEQFNNGFAKVEDTGLINRQGQEVISPEDFLNIRGFYDGLIAVEKGFYANGESSYKWGYIDIYKNTIIDFQFDRAGNFSQGLAAVCIDDRWGYINKLGQLVIDFRFDYAYPFNESIAMIEMNGQYGYIGTDGQIVIPIEYDDARNICEDRIAVQKGSYWGFIDSKGIKVIPMVYDQVSSFKNGIAWVKKDGQCWYIGYDNEEKIPTKFDSVTQFDNVYHLARIKIKGKSGLINTKGEFIIPPRYEKILTDSAYANFYLIMESDKFGFCKKDGQIIFQPKYDYKSQLRFANGVMVVAIDGMCGLINYLGTEIVPPKYDNIYHFDSILPNNGITIYKQNDKYGLLDNNGVELCPAIYDNIDQSNRCNRLSVTYQGKMGFIDNNGILVIPCIFDKVNTFIEDGTALVHYGQDQFFINRQGKFDRNCHININSSDYNKFELDIDDYINKYNNLIQSYQNDIKYDYGE